MLISSLIMNKEINTIFGFKKANKTWWAIANKTRF